MKKTLLTLIFTAFVFITYAQDLPSNPEPGKCYVRCTTPDVWKNENVTIESKAAYKKIVTRPAEYKTEVERVLVKEASTRLEIVPAVYETREVVVVTKEASHKLRVVPAEYGSETVSYVSKEDATKLRTIPATFRNDSETIEVKAASAEWQMSDRAPDCQSSNPDDCRYWCYKAIPAQFVTVDQVKLSSDATTERSPVPGNSKSYNKTVLAKAPTTVRIDIPEETKIVKKVVMVTPPTTRTIDIPAEYDNISKVVLVKDAWSEEVTVPAEYKTVTKEVLVTKGGLTTWKEVDCTALEYNDLLIDWNLDSATLTSKAKSEIDAKLLPFLKDGLRVEIASHTDSRGNDDYNKDLSERRAQAVTNYLISKGINPSLVVSNGYGESRLINRCANGVSCTEREHRANRRTQFRVIQ